MKIFIIYEKDIAGLSFPDQQMIRHCLQAIKDKRPAGKKKIAFEFANNITISMKREKKNG